jgi:hypothetical protein
MTYPVEFQRKTRYTSLAQGITIEAILRSGGFVYFAESYSIRRSLLGRQGWLQLVLLGLDDYHSELYLRANL